MHVRTFDDASAVLEVSGAFLATEPVRHNLILTLLEQRAASREPGRFWVVNEDDDVVGVVFQSPLHFFATVTPMPFGAIRAVVETIADQGVALPGVNGEATTAAAFAGHWTERARVGARPVDGMRLYEVPEVVETSPLDGTARRAVTADRDLMVEWFTAFEAEADPVPSGDLAAAVERRLAAGELWVWDHGEPVSFLGRSTPVAGGVRIGPVYTPPELRRHGYASALVAEVSRAARADGLRCLLFTDLANPTSNAIYRTIGYTAVSEVTRYEFDRAESITRS